MSEHDLVLPWRTDDPYPDVILDSNGEEVASFGNTDDCAATIRAVNSHDALVKALEQAASNFQSIAAVFREEGFPKIAAVADGYRAEADDTLAALVGGPKA